MTKREIRGRLAKWANEYRLPDHVGTACRLGFRAIMEDLAAEAKVEESTAAPSAPAPSRDRSGRSGRLGIGSG